jgi:hypothetical protein
MFRYLPLLQRRCSRLIVEVPPRLLELAPSFDGMGEVITWGEAAPAEPPHWDVQIEVTELPYLFRTSTADLPIAEEYLKLPAEVSRRAATAMGIAQHPRIGVVWSTGEWNLARALPFACIDELTRDRRFEFWNLQGGPAHDDWGRLPASSHLRDADELGSGILPLASVIEQLDLVITADTLAAHLAGAMGVPAWVLLQQSADWRWIHGRTDTPWYSSLRLFQQRTQGDWTSVLHEVSAALHAWHRVAA